MRSLLLLIVVCLASAFEFDLQAKGYKCLYEELPPNFDVYGEFDVKEGLHQTVDFKVQHENGQLLTSRSDINGKGDFSFIARLPGEYRFCFYNRLASGVSYQYGLTRRVSLDVYTGTETFDYQNVARREHLKPVEINLRMMEDIVKQIYGEHLYLKGREEMSRATNQSTHGRVLTTALVGVAIMVGFGVWQAFYLKKFFVDRKVV